MLALKTEKIIHVKFVKCKMVHNKEIIKIIKEEGVEEGTIVEVEEITRTKASTVMIIMTIMAWKLLQRQQVMVSKGTRKSSIIGRRKAMKVVRFKVRKDIGLRNSTRMEVRRTSRTKTRVRIEEMHRRANIRKFDTRIKIMVVA